MKFYPSSNNKNKKKIFLKIKTIIFKDILPSICKLSAIQSASNQRILDTLPRLHQTSQIGGSSESVALSRKGRNLMQHSQDCKLDLNAVQLFKLAFGLPGGVRLRIVLLHQSALSDDQSRVLLLQLFADQLQLLTVNFGTNRLTIRNQLKISQIKFLQRSTKCTTGLSCRIDLVLELTMAFALSEFIAYLDCAGPS